LAAKREKRPKDETRPAGHRGKQTVIVVLLVLVAVWPFGHRALVAAYDVNPWKLAGWAMYATPTPPVLAAIFQPVGKGGIPIPRESLPESVGVALDEFVMERHALGDFRRPDEVAALVLESNADLDEVVVMVQRMILDSKTALMTSRNAIYRYDRTGLLLETHSG